MTISTEKSILLNDFCRRFGIALPIVSAGMGLAAKAHLAAAVSNAGGLGFIGCTTLTPDEIRAQIRLVRELTDRPFGIDLLFPSSTTAGPEKRVPPEKIPSFLQEFRAELELKPWAERRDELLAVSPKDAGWFKDQLQAVIDERVPCFASGLGLAEWVPELLHAHGIAVFALVGNVRQARRVAAFGADVVVAQGYDAGGHTGRIGTMALVPQVVDAVAPVPVLAAGGIADGRGLVAALALGAQGAWIGTRFLSAKEANIPTFVQSRLLELSEEDTDRTPGWTGYAQRTMRNRFTRTWEESGLKPFFPAVQQMLTHDIEDAAVAHTNLDLARQAVGQVVGMVREVQSAGDIVSEIAGQALDVVLHRIPH